MRGRRWWRDTASNDTAVVACLGVHITQIILEETFLAPASARHERCALGVGNAGGAACSGAVDVQLTVRVASNRHAGVHCCVAGHDGSSIADRAADVQQCSQQQRSTQRVGRVTCHDGEEVSKQTIYSVCNRSIPMTQNN